MNRKILVIGAMGIAAIVLAGCATKGKNMETLDTYAILDHKGAATGTNRLPVWLTVYLDANGGTDTAVERLPDFKGRYCFIGTAESTNKKFAQTWAADVSGPTLIAASISTRVENVINANENGEEVTDAQRDEAVMERVINAVRDTVQSATFSGARREGDWWIQIRTYDPDDHSVVLSEEYRAYVLYTIERKSLDQQVALRMQHFADDDKEMSAEERAAYNRLINRIQEQGLGIEPEAAPTTTITVPGGVTATISIPQ